MQSFVTTADVQAKVRVSLRTEGENQKIAQAKARDILGQLVLDVKSTNPEGTILHTDTHFRTAQARTRPEERLVIREKIAKLQAEQIKDKSLIREAGHTLHSTIRKAQRHVTKRAAEITLLHTKLNPRHLKIV
jgi:hypothetical protein